MLEAGRRCGTSKGEASIIDSLFGDKTGAGPAASLPASLSTKGDSQSQGSINTRASPDHLSLSSMSELRQPFLQLQWVCAQSCPTLCNPMDCRHLSHAQHVPGTSLVLNMSHLEQMVPFNNHNEVCIITQTRKQRLFYKQGNRDSQKLKVIRLRSKNK